MEKDKEKKLGIRQSITITDEHTIELLNKIIELDRGRIYEYEANYSKYLELKAERLEAFASREKKIQTFLRKEYEWIKRGARARATKEKKRVEKYEELRLNQSNNYTD